MGYELWVMETLSLLKLKVFFPHGKMTLFSHRFKIRTQCQASSPTVSILQIHLNVSR